VKVLCFSSFTFGYLNRARVLFQSVKRHHPDWHCVALVTDEPPTGFEWRVPEPFDEVVYAKDLGIPEFRKWLFKHDIVEVCTAVKGPYAHYACSLGYDAVIYLDPDTCLFSQLKSVLAALETSDIALTPHQLKPDSARQAVVDNEVTSLKTGIYNLGFLAIRTTGEGRRMAKWWNDRLLSFCYDDVAAGLFVDQRWCDHVPSFFDRVAILRDPGLNVASWNLSHRTVSVDQMGKVLVNGSPLGFWHFTKLGRIGDTMTRRYAGTNFPVYELWAWYRRQVEEATSVSVPAGYWAFGTFESGRPIPKSARELYRHRVDLQDAFDDPFGSGPGSFEEWLSHEGQGALAAERVAA
jgi:hypothetical protein